MAYQRKKTFPAAQARTGIASQLKFDQLDGRTSIAKAALALSDMLTEYVGDCDDVVSASLLIERITYKALKLRMHEHRCLETLEITESTAYLAMANSLRQDLQALKQLVKKPKNDMTLDKYLAEFRGKKVK